MSFAIGHERSGWLRLVSLGSEGTGFVLYIMLVWVGLREVRFYFVFVSWFS
jgi:hypothetical protein